VKELLSRNAIPFTVYNVDEDDRAYDDLVALGWRTVPVTVVGARIINGYDAVALETAIAEWRTHR
jgi:glutaredoxin